MNSTTTQAQQFAAAYAETLAKGLIKSMETVRKIGTGIMYGAMAVSFSHQVTFFHNLQAHENGPIAVVTAWFASIVIPLVMDGLTALCVRVTGTRGMAPAAKKAALQVLMFPVLISGAVNFMAPGPWIMKGVYALVVSMIPAAEYVANKIAPDFGAMHAMELDVRPAEAVEVVDPELAAQRRAAALKAAETRRANAAEAAERAAAKQAARKARAAERAALETVYDLPAAPVSPAPATWDRVQRMLDKAQTA